MASIEVSHRKGRLIGSATVYRDTEFELPVECKPTRCVSFTAIPFCFVLSGGKLWRSSPISDILPIDGSELCGKVNIRRLFGHTVLLFDLGGTIAAVRMFAMAIVVTVRHTAELYRQEPLP